MNNSDEINTIQQPLTGTVNDTASITLLHRVRPIIIPITTTTLLMYPAASSTDDGYTLGAATTCFVYSEDDYSDDPVGQLDNSNTPLVSFFAIKCDCGNGPPSRPTHTHKTHTHRPAHTSHPECVNPGPTFYPGEGYRGEAYPCCGDPGCHNVDDSFKDKAESFHLGGLEGSHCHLYSCEDCGCDGPSFATDEELLGDFNDQMESYNCNNGPPVIPPYENPLIAFYTTEGFGRTPYLGCDPHHTCNPIQDGYKVKSFTFRTGTTVFVLYPRPGCYGAPHDFTGEQG